MSEGSANQTIGASYLVDANGEILVDANGEYLYVQDPGQTLQIATGGILPGGFAAQTIDPFTQVATGAALDVGNANQLIDVFDQAAEGIAGNVGSAAQTIGDFSQVATGAPGDPIVIPEDITSPVVSGLFAPAGILSCTTGTFGDAVVLSYSFQWRVAGADVPGETSNQCFVRGAFGGQIMACMVTATTSETTLQQLSNEVLIDEAGSGTGSTATSTNSNRKPLWWQSAPKKKKAKKAAPIVQPPKPKPPIHVPRYNGELAAEQSQVIDGLLAHTASTAQQLRQRAIEQDDEAILLRILQ